MSSNKSDGRRAAHAEGVQLQECLILGTAPISRHNNCMTLAASGGVEWSTLAVQYFGSTFICITTLRLGVKATGQSTRTKAVRRRMSSDSVVTHYPRASALVKVSRQHRRGEARRFWSCSSLTHVGQCLEMRYDAIRELRVCHWSPTSGFSIGIQYRTVEYSMT